MVTFPNAKINLGLNIVARRDDGYHNIESCFYPIPLTDALEIIPSDTPEFTSSGIAVEGENLCERAWKLLNSQFGIGPIKLHLHKAIPIGAGLGGGSSDAAFTLKMLNQLFELKLENRSLVQYADVLGADCPFFIQNDPSFVEGKGEIFSPLKVDLSGLYLALIYPEIMVPTPDAYKSVTPGKHQHSLADTLTNKPVGEWKHLVTNDFEAPIFEKYPAIAEIKDSLYANGAIFAAMTGSGSAVYGLFETKPKIKSGTTEWIFEL